MARLFFRNNLRKCLRTPDGYFTTIFTAFLGIRLVKLLPEKEFRIFTTVATIVNVLVMLLT